MASEIWTSRNDADTQASMIPAIKWIVKQVDAPVQPIFVKENKRIQSFLLQMFDINKWLNATKTNK